MLGSLCSCAVSFHRKGILIVSNTSSRIPKELIVESGELLAYSDCPVFTVGHAKVYDEGLVEYGDDYMKLGRCVRDGERYPGGFAVNTIDDGLRLIEEQGKAGIWGVYRLDAVWSKDTEPSEDGWWHNLVNDARIVERVA